VKLAKPGDQVVCANPQDGLTVGRVYIVRDVDDGIPDNTKTDYILTNDDGNVDRFISEAFDVCGTVEWLGHKITLRYNDSRPDAVEACIINQYGEPEVKLLTFEADGTITLAENIHPDIATGVQFGLNESIVVNPTSKSTISQIPTKELQLIVDTFRNALKNPNNAAAQTQGKIAVTTLHGYSADEIATAAADEGLIHRFFTPAELQYLHDCLPNDSEDQFVLGLVQKLL
jgi:hypothetical protein